MAHNMRDSDVHQVVNSLLALMLMCVLYRKIFTYLLKELLDAWVAAVCSKFKCQTVRGV